jgi:hypothetical protein
MKRMIIAILSLASLSAVAAPCQVELIQEMLDGKVGAKHAEIRIKADEANEAGNQALFETTKKQADKVMLQIMELANEACK